MKNITRKATTAIALSGLLLAVNAPVFANKKDRPASVQASAAEPTVTYISNDANSSTFLVNYNPGTKSKFELNVYDVNGDAIYRQIFEADSFSKYVKLVNNADENAAWSFSFRIVATGKIHNFDVSSNVKLVRNVVVVKQ
jgi:hypothetical protein